MPSPGAAGIKFSVLLTGAAPTSEAVEQPRHGAIIQVKAIYIFA